MNDQTIQMIAQAIIANTKVIQSLIDALPHETRAAVADAVKPAAVAPAPAPVAAPLPVATPVAAPLPVATPVAPAPAPVVAAPVAPVVASPSNMPAPPVFTAAPAPAPAGVPFSDSKGLIDYVMGVYKQLGPQKGSQIQSVLTGLGLQNINDVKSEQYSALFAGIEALKA